MIKGSCACKAVIFEIINSSPEEKVNPIGRSIMLNLIYKVSSDVIKFIKRRYTYKESEKVVDFNFINQLKKKYEDAGEKIDFAWSDESKVESRKAEGWDPYYLVDKKKREKYILRNNDPSRSILIFKKNLNN